MLTVLIKHNATGREVLFPAQSVEYVSTEGNDPGDGLIINWNDGGGHWPNSETAEDARQVFVMNEAGKTVARYSL